MIKIDDLFIMEDHMNPQKIALITGITGQDGSYLAEFLLKKDLLTRRIAANIKFTIVGFM